MTVPRLLAIVVIFVGAAVAWFALGASLTIRSGEHDSRLAHDVARLWGGPQVQVAPTAFVRRPLQTTETVADKDAGGRVVSRRDVTRQTFVDVPVPLVASKVDVRLDLEHRRLGSGFLLRRAGFDAPGFHLARQQQIRGFDGGRLHQRLAAVLFSACSAR